VDMRDVTPVISVRGITKRSQGFLTTDLFIITNLYKFVKTEQL